MERAAEALSGRPLQAAKLRVHDDHGKRGTRKTWAPVQDTLKCATCPFALCNIPPRKPSGSPRGTTATELLLHEERRASDDALCRRIPALHLFSATNHVPASLPNDSDCLLDLDASDHLPVLGRAHVIR